MYGGMCHGGFTASAISLARVCEAQGIKFTAMFLHNESLIQRARNRIATYFLSIPDATHLIFIDGDTTFEVNDIVRMLNADKPIIISPVPMKGINWERVRKAAIDGEDNLADYSGFYTIHDAINFAPTDREQPFQIGFGGTGFMIIRRDVFETLIPRTRKYKNDQDMMSTIEEIYDFFRVEIDERTNHLLSEDYYFCIKYRNAGGEIWCAPWCTVGHTGSYTFMGNYSKDVLGKLGVFEEEKPKRRRRTKNKPSL